MDITTFLKGFGTDAKAAEALGYKERTIASWRRRERKPRPDEAGNLIAKSGGALTYEGIFGVPDSQPKYTGPLRRETDRRAQPCPGRRASDKGQAA